MFKSVFIKYLTTFMLIILLSFIVLLLVISSMINNFAIENKIGIMDVSSEFVANNLNILFNENMGIEKIVEEFHSSVNASLVTAKRHSKSDVYIFNGKGKMLICSDPEDTAAIELPAAVLSSLLSGNWKELYSQSDLEENFGSIHLNNFYVIKTEPKSGNEPDIAAVILVTSGDIGNKEFTNQLIRTIITVSLWIFLAALISVYFISERIVEPLKQISVAAKNFTMGKFGERVKAAGRDEVAELAQTFNNMADSLERSEELRSAFLANVSHDLRTPMTTISGFVDGIIDGTIPADKHGYYLGIISTEVRRLSRLVNTLLEISRLDSGNTVMKNETFNLSEKARQVLISFENKIDAKKLEIEFENEEDLYVGADTDAIHQVLYNLIDNAVKFTPEGGSISITITPATVKKIKKAQVTIKNTGQGIPEDEIPFLFERFYKSDRSRGLDKTGTGLGLYIVKTTLLSHGEEINVSSKTDGFTEFSFQLKIIEKN